MGALLGPLRPLGWPLEPLVEPLWLLGCSLGRFLLTLRRFLASPRASCWPFWASCRPTCDLSCPLGVFRGLWRRFFSSLGNVFHDLLKNLHFSNENCLSAGALPALWVPPGGPLEGFWCLLNASRAPSGSSWRLSEGPLLSRGPPCEPSGGSLRES